MGAGDTYLNPLSGEYLQVGQQFFRSVIIDRRNRARIDVGSLEADCCCDPVINVIGFQATGTAELENLPGRNEVTVTLNTFTAKATATVLFGRAAI